MYRLLQRDKVTWPGARLRRKNEGMPNYDNNNLHGALYITFDVEFPKEGFSEDEKESKIFYIYFSYYFDKMLLEEGRIIE